jgi:hypothetical protein
MKYESLILKCLHEHVKLLQFFLEGNMLSHLWLCNDAVTSLACSLASTVRMKVRELQCMWKVTVVA